MSVEYWLLSLLVTVAAGVLVPVIQKIPAYFKALWKRFFIRYELLDDESGDGDNAPDHSDDYKHRDIPCVWLVPRLNSLNCLIASVGLFFLFAILVFTICVMIIGQSK